MNNNLPSGVCVLVDGGCLNNNKPVSDRVMYGSMTVFFNGNQVVSTYGDMPTALVHKFDIDHQEEWASNNLAELLTMEHALSYVDELHNRSRKVVEVTILCDSNLALGYASGTMKVGKKVDQSIRQSRMALDGMNIELERLGVKVNYQHVDEGWVKSVLGH